MLLAAPGDGDDFLEVEIVVGGGELAEDEIEGLHPHESRGDDSAVDGGVSVDAVFGFVVGEFGVEVDEFGRDDVEG